jgi:hypothetical protein
MLPIEASARILANTPRFPQPCLTLEERIACDLPIPTHLQQSASLLADAADMASVIAGYHTSDMWNYANHVDTGTHTHTHVQDRRIDWISPQRAIECPICCVSVAPIVLSCQESMPDNVLTLTQIYAIARAVDWEQICNNPTTNRLIRYDCGGTEAHIICRSCLFLWYYLFDRVDCNQCRIHPPIHTQAQAQAHVPASIDVGLLEAFVTQYQHPDPQHARVKQDAMDKKLAQSQHGTSSSALCATERLLQLVRQDPWSYDTTWACGICGTMLCHTLDCHALCHCRTETCFVCGLTCLAGHKLPPSHWNSHMDHGNGDKADGCPRYPWDAWWNQVAECGYQCKQEECFDHERECHEPHHLPGKMRYAYCVYQFRMYRLWVCMSPQEQLSFHLSYPEYAHRIQECITCHFKWMKDDVT